MKQRIKRYFSKHLTRSLWLLSLTSFYSFGNECSLDKPFIEVFICQGHSLLHMNLPNHVGRLEQKYRGFYPPGRIANEVDEGLYHVSDFDACQSICKILQTDEAKKLENLMTKIEKTTVFRTQGEWQSLLQRDNAYSVKDFNCVDFSHAVYEHITGRGFLNDMTFHGHPLRIFSDPLEPCFGTRDHPENCFHWGADKAAVWAYYRKGISQLLWQIFGVEKWGSFVSISAFNGVIGALLNKMTAHPVMYSVLTSLGLAGAAAADLLKFHLLPSSLAPLELSQLGITAAVVLILPITLLPTPAAGVIFAILGAALWYNGTTKPNALSEVFDIK